MKYDKTKGPWNDGSIKPHTLGVYERETIFFDYGYAYWDGKNWRIPESTALKAYLARNSGISAFQKLKWRGLANEPK